VATHSPVHGVTPALADERHAERKRKVLRKQTQAVVVKLVHPNFFSFFEAPTVFPLASRKK